MGNPSSNYGVRVHPVTGTTKMHEGIDYPAPIGSPVYTNTQLTVERVGNVSGYGNAVFARDRAGTQYIFGHLDSIPDGYKQGAVIPPGGLVAYTGNTGVSSGPHLHFETREYDPVTGRMKPFDPATTTDPFNGGTPYINNMSFNNNGGSLKSTTPQVAGGYIPKNGTQVASSGGPNNPNAKPNGPTIPQKGASPPPGTTPPSSYLKVNVNPLLKLGDV